MPFVRTGLEKKTIYFNDMNFWVGEFQPLVNEVVVYVLLVTFQKKRLRQMNQEQGIWNSELNKKP